MTQARFGGWRASTDNDLRAEWGLPHSDSELFVQAGLNRLHERFDEVDLVDGGVRVTSRSAGAAVDAGFSLVYRWLAVPGDDSAVDLVLDFVPEGRWPGVIARIGYEIALDVAGAADVAVNWRGQGPGESYSDSTKAVHYGAFEDTVASWQTRYTVPQENGAHRGVERAEFALAGGNLTLESGDVSLRGIDLPGFELSARPWSDKALDAAAHPHELKEDGQLWLHLDVAQHGLGTAACGPGVLPNARLTAAPARLGVRISLR